MRRAVAALRTAKQKYRGNRERPRTSARQIALVFITMIDSGFRALPVDQQASGSNPAKPGVSRRAAALETMRDSRQQRPVNGSAASSDSLGDPHHPRVRNWSSQPTSAAPGGDHVAERRPQVTFCTSAARRTSDRAKPCSTTTSATAPARRDAFDKIGYAQRIWPSPSGIARSPVVS